MNEKIQIELTVQELEDIKTCLALVLSAQRDPAVSFNAGVRALLNKLRTLSVQSSEVL